MIARHVVDDKGAAVKPVVLHHCKRLVTTRSFLPSPTLRPGALVDIYFDERGKVAYFKPKGVK